MRSWFGYDSLANLCRLLSRHTEEPLRRTQCEISEACRQPMQFMPSNLIKEHCNGIVSIVRSSCLLKVSMVIENGMNKRRPPLEE